MGMARATIARDAGELRFGDADHGLADGPIDCHCRPLVCGSPRAFVERC
jgi:hypothetical protein